MILTLQNGRQLYSKWRRKNFLPITSSIFKFLKNKCYQRIPQPEMHLKKTSYWCSCYRTFVFDGTIGFYIYCHRVSELEAEILIVRRHTIAHTNPLVITFLRRLSIGGKSIFRP